VNKESRQFERYEVSIPCRVTHMGETTKGKITNISLGGAFITGLLTLPPPEKAVITINFKVEKEEVEIKASVNSGIVRNLFDIQDDAIVGSIGIQFKGHSQEAQSQLRSTMRLIARLQAERDMLASRLREREG